jgi:opacity protein-like surface antigen
LAQDGNSIKPVAGLRGSLAFDSEISGSDNSVPPNTVKASADLGGGASIYWGAEFNYGFKAELELLYRSQGLSSATVNGVSGALGGTTQTFAPMANAYWYIPVGDLAFRPFVGIGVGYAWNDMGISSIGTTSFATVHNSKWGFAYNAMAGASIPLSANSRITGAYRWLHQDIGVTCTATIQCSGSQNASSFEIGIEFDL